MAMKIQVWLAHLLIGGVLLIQMAACSVIRSHSSQVSTATRGAGCSIATGSRVAPGAERCSALRRSFGSEEIRNTGATSVAEALRLLDPSISTRH
jgi:hypothetical protein